MPPQSYYVDKTNDTSADTLLAIGFASLLKRILRGIQKPSKGIVIRDVGPYYEIQLPMPITDSDLQRLEPFTLVRPLVTDKRANEQEEQGKTLDGFDYQGQQDIAKAYYEQLKKLPAHLRTPNARLSKEFQQIPDLTPPSSELVHDQTINQMKIASSFNEVALRWQALGELQREHIHLLLALFAQPNNDLAAVVAAWQELANTHKLLGKACVTELQIVNPTTGKGANRAKSSTLSEGNPDNFWLLELLKFQGFMDAAAPYVIQGSKDRKTYVLQPTSIELSTLQGMMRAFRAVCWSSTAIKMDIMASLRFAQVFITLREQSLRGENQQDEFVDEEQLYSVAQGFEVAFYKDMGSAYATMNVASINLPQWLPPIPTLEEAEYAQAILQEHLVIIQQLRNSKGEEGAEEFDLLRFYRNFLSGRDLKPFWHFTAAYSGYLISQREHEKDPRKHIRQFTINGLEHLLTMSTQGQKLTPITSNPGFKRIAYAIRESTVRAQYRRSQQRDRSRYEIRYGLGQELKREAHYPRKFIAALSDFLHEYNAETAREEEKVANMLSHPLTREDRRAYQLRGSVSYTDIDEIVALIDDFGSETVAFLLVAYGYASEPRKGESEATPAMNSSTDSFSTAGRN
ncbi:MAG: hypothetical protein JO202_19090 [Ktedonobacteraceae bacterium]|nr:hypothetical protein [Ktedonobacteraceae bacterium]